MDFHHTHLLVIATLVGAIAYVAGVLIARAQTTTDFYGPTGAYEGSATTTQQPYGGGSTTDYYGPTGGYQGSSTTTRQPYGGSSTTDFYGATGGYQGSATTTSPYPFGQRR
jgi:hypothetical protein